MEQQDAVHREGSILSRLQLKRLTAADHDGWPGSAAKGERQRRHIGRAERRWRAERNPVVKKAVRGDEAKRDTVADPDRRRHHEPPTIDKGVRADEQLAFMRLIGDGVHADVAAHDFVAFAETQAALTIKRKRGDLRRRIRQQAAALFSIVVALGRTAWLVTVRIARLAARAAPLADLRSTGTHARAFAAAPVAFLGSTRRSAGAFRATFDAPANGRVGPVFALAIFTTLLVARRDGLRRGVRLIRLLLRNSRRETG